MKVKIWKIIAVSMLLIVGIPKTYAASIPIDNYEMIPQGQYYDCTSSGCSSVGTTADTYQTYNNEYAMIVNSSTMTIATNGVAFSYQPYETLKAGYLYNITTYYCSNKDLGNTTKTQFLGQANSTAVQTNYATTNSQSIADIGPFDYCYEIQTLISPKANTRYISYKMTNSSSISGVYLYSLGFKIKDLGIYTSEIQTIISNVLSSATSGLATSNQLNTVAAEIEAAQAQAANDINNNANTNSQNEINAANQNTQDQINSQKVCRILDENYVKYHGYLTTDGSLVEQTTGTNYTSEYISITKDSELRLNKSGQTSLRYCFYSNTKSMINCGFSGSLQENQSITIPTNAAYMRYTMKTDSTNYGPTYELCTGGNQALNDTLNQDHDYNTNASETIDGQNELNSMENKENQLRDSLDFSGASDLDISIDSDTNSFIWNVVNALRTISSKIVLLMTSFLGLGIIKMILNR